MFQDTPSATEVAGSLEQYNSAIHVKVISTPRSVAKKFQGAMPARLPGHGQVSKKMNSSDTTTQDKNSVKTEKQDGQDIRRPD